MFQGFRVFNYAVACKSWSEGVMERLSELNDIHKATFDFIENYNSKK